MNKKDLTKIIEHYGKQLQVVVAIEELSELQKELCKYLRDKPNRLGIIEELSDVYLMLEQLKIIFGITDTEINEIIDSKIKRTLKRINDDNI